MAAARILLIDEDQDVALAMRGVLEDAGYVVSVLADLDATAIRTAVRDLQPQAILLDVSSSDALRVCTAETRWHEQIPLIAVSTTTRDTIEQPDHTAAVFAILTKPFATDELLATVRRAVVTQPREIAPLGLAAGRLLATLEQLLAIPATSLEEALAKAAAVLADVFGAEKVDAWVPRGDELVAIGVSDTPLGRKEIALGLDRLPLGRRCPITDVFRTCEPYRTGHADLDKRMHPGIVQDLGIRSMLCMPFQVAREPRGLLLLSSTQADAFTDQHVGFLRTVAGWVGLVAHRGELFAAEVARAAAERARQDAETSAKALAASEARFRRALEIETVGVIFFDTAGAITDANDAFLRMSGYSRTDLAAGRVRWDTMTPPEWMPRSLGAVKELKETGQTTPYEKEYLRKNGSRWWALFAATLLDPERGVEFVLDLTERKAAEAERERALAEARAAVQARDEFLAIASHELRNPLAGLKGNAQMLRRLDERGELQPHELGKYLTALEASADRLTRLVEDLLDVARLRTGQLKLRREVANLPKLLQEAADRQQHGNLARKITLKITCPNCHVRADPDRVGQVLSNLLDNAVKYSPSGGDISVSLAAADDAVVVRVTDQGIGLPAGMAESIFEPFGRAPNAAAQQIPGMGLGLYISRQIAEAHGGRLWAESAGEGEGATFTLWLPIGAAESA